MDEAILLINFGALIDTAGFCLCPLLLGHDFIEDGHFGLTDLRGTIAIHKAMDNALALRYYFL
jgi:hypothetical protein